MLTFRTSLEPLGPRPTYSEQFEASIGFIFFAGFCNFMAARCDLIDF